MLIEEPIQVHSESLKFAENECLAFPQAILISTIIQTQCNYVRFECRFLRHHFSLSLMFTVVGIRFDFWGDADLRYSSFPRNERELECVNTEFVICHAVN